MTNKQWSGFTLNLKCVNNDGYPSSLEIGKIYKGAEAQRGAFAVIDESGEAYAYSRKRFELADEKSAD